MLQLQQLLCEQPQGWAEIDWSSPLARGLSLSLVPSVSLLDQVTGEQWVTFGTAPKLNPARLGIAGDSSAAFGGYRLQPSKNVSTAAQSMMFVGEFLSKSGNYAGLMAVTNATGSSNSFTFQDAAAGVFALGQDTTLSATSLSSSVAFGPSVIIAVGGDGPASAYKDGAVILASGGGVPTTKTDSRIIVMGERQASASFSVKGRVYLFAHWTRRLLDTEIAALSANPWQLFTRRIWIPVSTATGGGSTVLATPAEASAIGVAASIVAGSSTTINAGPGLASAAGVVALLNTSTVAVIGNASATGVTATIVAGSSTTINAGPGLASATGVTSRLNVALLAGIGNASAAGVTALLKSTTQATPAEAAATGVAASIIGTSPVTIAASPGSASAVGVTASLDFGGSLLIGGRRLFPQVQRKRETDEEKRARRIAQGIVEVAKQSASPAAPAPTVAPVAPIRMRASVPVAAEVEVLKARAAIQADKEIKRIQALKAVQQEEEDVFYVMSVLARA